MKLIFVYIPKIIQQPISSTRQMQMRWQISTSREIGIADYRKQVRYKTVAYFIKFSIAIVDIFTLLNVMYYLYHDVDCYGMYNLRTSNQGKANMGKSSHCTFDISDYHQMWMIQMNLYSGYKLFVFHHTTKTGIRKLYYEVI